jgi:hypothetical protein
MKGGKKRAWANKLLRYIDSCRAKLHQDMVLTLKDEKDIYLALALLALYQSGIDQAKAVAHCVAQGLGVASRTCLRALVELTIDVRLMLDHGDCFENAVRFLTAANLELLRTVQEKKIDWPRSVESLEENLSDYSKSYPKAVHELRNEFNRRGFIKHWSGLSYRKRLSAIRGAAFPELHFTYSVLSWDAHSKLAAFRSSPKLGDGVMGWMKLEEKDESYLFPDIETAVMVFSSLSSAVFLSPISKKKTSNNQKDISKRN